MLDMSYSTLPLVMAILATNYDPLGRPLSIHLKRYRNNITSLNEERLGGFPQPRKTVFAEPENNDTRLMEIMYR